MGVSKYVQERDIYWKFAKGRREMMFDVALFNAILLKGRMLYEVFMLKRFKWGLLDGRKLFLCTSEDMMH